jgi:lipopolysaccharide/colanic/teichoic acid biosynthesis glycosyltransferase
MDEIKNQCESGQCDLVVCSSMQLSIASIMSLLQAVTSYGVDLKVNSMNLMTIQQHAQESMDSFAGAPLVHFNASAGKAYKAWIKNILSIVANTIITLGCLPLFIVIPICLRLTSRGPALYQQARIGKDRQPFTMYKFRTMRLDADKELPDFEPLNESGLGLFKIKNDPRIIPAGRLLRRFSLDELPQVINIFKGDMMLVGPRPLPLRDFKNYAEEWQYLRHDGYPGLTCLWQVSGRSDLGFNEMCILDIYYLHNQNLIMDIKIMFKTISVVLFAKGAY